MNHSDLKPTVAVLMSTYNGEDFISEQIDSLIAQNSVIIELYVRDDGSNDETINLIKKYTDIWPHLESLGPEDNLKPSASFLKLLDSTPKYIDYYAFCDQDDVWLPEKMSLALEKLSLLPRDKPSLYCSLASCVDSELRPLGQTVFRGSVDFEALMFANMVAGNTLVMNNAAATLVRSKTPGSAIIMHDWWCALIVSAFGEIVCDDRRTLLYRQHHGNVQGAGSGRIAGLVLQLRAFFRDPRSFYPIHAQIVEFLRLYGDKLRPAERAAAEALARSRRTLASRIAYALFGNIPRWDLWGAVGTRALIAMGWY